ncbi:uncharacterized protein LOC143823475 isoform X2 [Paroedura picta]|uniref:uncharacterized protein LOC143823475 isoform X2 n=1 Tax=Paroedura picta TaxID=143630 RepID=UPI0010145249
MATFVPYASCYGNKQAVQLLGRNSYFSLFANPPCLIAQRQKLACPAPEMTLRQISHLIRILRQLNLRDAKGSQLPGPQRSRSSSSSTESQQSRTSEQHCLSCFQTRRNSGPPCV